MKQTAQTSIIGSVSRVGDQLIVRFNYTPQRVAAIKSFPRSRYEPKSRSWQLPVSSLPKLEKSPHFNRRRLEYDFAPSATHVPADNLTREALTRWKRHPLKVKGEDLALINADLKIRLSDSGRLVLGTFSERAALRQYVESAALAVWSKREDSFVLDPRSVGDLVRFCRSHSITFAVTAEASSLLQETAELRSAISSGTDVPTEEDLERSLIQPFLDSCGNTLCVDTEGRESFGWSYCELTKRGGLTVERRRDALALRDIPAFTHLEGIVRANSSVRFIPLPDDDILRLYPDHTDLPASPNFRHYFELLRYRKELTNQRRYYQKLKDIDLSGEPFTDSGLISKLYPHQRVAVKWLLDTPRAFLGDDMGLGKTLSVLAAYDVLRNRRDVDFILVIAPTSLTRNWKNESENWTPHLRLSVISGSKKEKLHAIKQIGWGGVKCDGVILNYESIRLDYVRDEISSLLRKKSALLVIDESQRVKNPRGETFKSFSTLARLTNRRVLLSGTPTPKDISDIWTQYYLLDDGERFGRNFYRWLESIADIGNKYSAVAVNSFKPEQVRETIRRAQEIMLRRKKDEVINLPQKIFTTRYVKLSGEQAKRYDEIRKDLLLRMTSVNGKSYIRAIDSILEEYLRAVQVASNPRLIDQSWIGEPAKFKELDSIVEEIVKERDEKIVIWTNYIANTKELVTRYKDFGAADFSGEISPEKRNEIVARFQNDPACRILVAVPAAGGVGITLTAAQTAVYIDKTWNGEHWMQSVDRLHRIGQTGTVNIISIIACKIDELISSNLKKKERLQREVLGDDERRAQREAGEDYALPSLEELREALAG